MAKVIRRGNSWGIDYFDPSGKRVRKFNKKWRRKDAENELAARRISMEDGDYFQKKKEYTSTLGEVSGCMRRITGIRPASTHLSGWR